MSDELREEDDDTIGENVAWIRGLNKYTHTWNFTKRKIRVKKKIMRFLF